MTCVVRDLPAVASDIPGQALPIGFISLPSADTFSIFSPDGSEPLPMNPDVLLVMLHAPDLKGSVSFKLFFLFPYHALSVLA